ncbi:MAG: alpha-L-arabinofuranosidase [Ignavibacteria bacterium GWC2_36_12]|nr:MAG: alpha-L-arabinofuranosidase [Ignavibacteria bacterium GWC2_36_12]
MKKIIIFFILLVFTGSANGQLNKLVVDVSNSKAKIQPTMYGIFFEDINFAADGGLYAEMIKNRGFEFEEPMMGWLQPNSNRFSLNANSGVAEIIKEQDSSSNRNICRITINNDTGYILLNEGFRGMGIKKNARYQLSLLAAKQSGDIQKINFSFVNNDEKIMGITSIMPDGQGWTTYTTELTATDTEAKARLKITFEGTGVIDLDMISLFSEDTWKGRKNGLRKDLVQLLYDLKPGFLRFPGGCIVEGRTLAKRYQWKKTVGPVDERTVLVNRWNTEFRHRPTPDYFQSFGLGFFEYFQLAEDIGAEPLPILNCGMACQFNTGELVPLEQLDPYVQDALDLIEFANGSVSSPWGKVRSDMGHPKPFNMKYIGIGNEQWGQQYIERYKIFEKALREKYPDIIIVSALGPFPDGELFDYAMDEMKRLNAEIVDEHYYKPPQWFRENSTRYDSYDRNGPKIFAGEYAAQSVAIASPDNKNNWECALSEAAFMTGLERNADLVVMTSYAPLFAHADAWQWTPDLIWFNNLSSYGTANYYVQKMYSTHRGTDLLSISFEDGKAVTGQNGLYSSAVKDSDSGELFIKLVNTSDKLQQVFIELKNKKLADKADVLTLTSDNLSDVNSFDNPDKISPTESQIEVENNHIKTGIDPYTFLILKIGLKQ